MINASHHADQLVAALGDGSAFGARIRCPSTRAARDRGGVTTALPLLSTGPDADRVGRIWTTFDYASLGPARSDGARRQAPRGHLVMVPIPTTTRSAISRCATDCCTATAGRCSHYGNIGLYDTALFGELARVTRIQMLPLYRAWIARGIASGERYDGVHGPMSAHPAIWRRSTQRFVAGIVSPSCEQIEVPPMTANPLLEFPGLPRFDAITPVNVTPAVDGLLSAARATWKP